MRGSPDELTELARRVVEPMGYELVGVEYLPRGKGQNLLRVFIDHPHGITLDDCSDVSHQLSGLLDVEDPIRSDYSLEVSSPGLDRPLFFKEHFERFAGSKVRLKSRAAVDGQRKFVGILDGMEDDTVLLTVDGNQLRLPFEQIDSARLVPEF